MNLTVVGPRVFIKPEKLPDVSEGGLHLVRDHDAMMRGTIVAVGDGPRSKNGTVLDHIVSVGDRVLFSPDRGEELFFEKDLYISMLEDDILAVIE